MSLFPITIKLISDAPRGFEKIGWEGVVSWEQISLSEMKYLLNLLKNGDMF
jgi:hypothetical protein